jgi:transposase
MLRPSGWWLVLASADLRCGIDRLLVMIASDLGRDPRDGGAYVFRNRAGTRIKVVCVDATGVWLSVRRLHDGRFVWPRAGDATCALSPEQFAWLSAGVDWQRLSRSRESLHEHV